LEKHHQLNRNDDNKLFLLGSYQIAGGAYGAVLILFMIGDISSYPIGKVLILIFGILLFAYSTFCGYLLITHRLLKGLKYSIYNNALQIIGIGAAGYQFKFVSGFFGGLTLDLTEDTIVGFGFDFSTIELAFASKSGQIFMTVNIIAILVLGFIYKLKEKIERQMVAS